MRDPTPRLSWLLLLASCFSDSGGDTGSSTAGDTTASSSLSDGTTSSPMSGDPSTGPTTGPTTTGSTTTTTSGPTTTTGAPVDELSCSQYCETYAAACVDFTEYANTELCIGQCKQWPVGVVGETAGDSLGCRQYHADIATAVDPDLHCPHAGPSGAGTCVAADAPKCQDYCATYLANCKDFPAYVDDADCTAQCARWYPGVTDATSGDSLGCRLYHAGVALADPRTHCPHAAPDGAGVCVVQ